MGETVEWLSTGKPAEMTERSPLSAYRNSAAWQKSMYLVREIYSLTRTFPSDERFGLTNQLRRAAVSIPSNIAEGKGRLGLPELIQFIGFARGSTLEVCTQLEIALTLGFASDRDILKAQELATEVLCMLNASLTTLRAKQGARRH